jgi:hypothetical protein
MEDKLNATYDLKENKGKEELLKIYGSYEPKDNHIGEYNGKPIFVDGDSLLMHCLLHPLVDKTHGLEIVQIINFVELFIQKFERNVEIIFFEILEDVWKNSSELLARNLIKQHLKNINLTVKEFETWESENFLNYVEINSPAFVLVSKPEKLPNNCFEESKFLFMHQITFFTLNNINTVTQNGLRYEPEGFLFLKF